MSASIVQYWMSKHVRDSVRRLHARAATKIQCAWRQRLARNKVRDAIETRRRLVAERNAALLEAENARFAANEAAKADAAAAHRAENERRMEAAQNEQLARQELLRQLRHAAAITIQCAYRCYNARFMRAWKAQERHEKRVAAEKRDFAAATDAAARRIQKQIRRFVARCKVERLQQDKRDRQRAAAAEESRRHAAAVRIQCMYRCHNARFEVAWRREDRKKQEAKMNLAKKAEEDRMMGAIRDKELLQQLAQKQNRCALTIQCAWRCYNARFELMWRVEAKQQRKMEVEAQRKGLLLGRIAQRVGRGYLSRRQLYHERVLVHTLAAQELLLAEYEADSVINDVLGV